MSQNNLFCYRHHNKLNDQQQQNIIIKISPYKYVTPLPRLFFFYILIFYKNMACINLLSYWYRVVNLNARHACTCFKEPTASRTDLVRLVFLRNRPAFSVWTFCPSKLRRLWLCFTVGFAGFGVLKYVFSFPSKTLYRFPVFQGSRNDFLNVFILFLLLANDMIWWWVSKFV